MSKEAHQSIPQSFEAEQGALGSILFDPITSLENCASRLPKGYFYDGGHQQIYEVILGLWKANKVIDPITLTQALKDLGILAKVGGAAAVTNLFTCIPTSASLEYYIEILREKYLLREVIRACMQGHQDALDPTAEVDTIVTGIADRIERAREAAEDQELGDHTLFSRVGRVLDRLEALNGGKMNLYQTGVRPLDEKLGGFEPGKLIVIAGQSSSGKTALASQIYTNLVLGGVKCLYFPCEQTGDQLTERILLSLSSTSVNKFRLRAASERDFASLYGSIKRVKGEAKENAYIYDLKGRHISEVRQVARMFRRKHGVQVVFLDYAQLLRGDGQDEVRQLDDLARKISEECGTTGLSYVLLSQLNEGNKAKGSRAIFEACRYFLRVDRPLGEEDAKIHIDKNETGPVCSVDVTFNGRNMRFE